MDVVYSKIHKVTIIRACALPCIHSELETMIGMFIAKERKRD
jgi:hypothetical protein